MTDLEAKKLALDRVSGTVFFKVRVSYDLSRNYKAINTATFRTEDTICYYWRIVPEEDSRTEPANFVMIVTKDEIVSFITSNHDVSIRRSYNVAAPIQHVLLKGAMDLNGF
jgi:hypothetical protein